MGELKNTQNTSGSKRGKVCVYPPRLFWRDRQNVYSAYPLWITPTRNTGAALFLKICESLPSTNHPSNLLALKLLQWRIKMELEEASRMMSKGRELYAEPLLPSANGNALHLSWKEKSSQVDSEHV